MIPITNGSKRVTTWEQDGYHFRELIKQEYSGNGCVFSAGVVTGHPIDTLYFRIQKDGCPDEVLLLRPDEMAAIAWVASGSLFSLHLEEVVTHDPIT